MSNRKGNQLLVVKHREARCQTPRVWKWGLYKQTVYSRTTQWTSIQHSTVTTPRSRPRPLAYFVISQKASAYLFLQLEVAGCFLLGTLNVCFSWLCLQFVVSSFFFKDSQYSTLLKNYIQFDDEIDNRQIWILMAWQFWLWLLRVIFIRLLMHSYC